MYHNDKEVFVQAIIKDKALQQKFLMHGLTLYFDLTGKKNKKYGVVFPNTSPRMMHGENMTKSNDGQRRQERQQKMSIQPLVESLLFESAYVKSDKSESCLDRARAQISTNEEDLIYTCILTYELIGSKIGKKQLIAIGLTSEITQPNGMHSDRPEGGMPPSGMGRGPGGGGPGEGHRGGMGERPSGERPSRESMSEMTKTFNQWITFSVK